MDALFEAQFSPLADSGRLLSKCGKCIRYMKYIFTQPSRLYCGTCEDVYYLPQKGTIKVIQIIFEDSFYLYSNTSFCSPQSSPILGMVKYVTLADQKF